MLLHFTIGSRTLKGDAVSICEKLKNRHFKADEFKTLDEFMEYQKWLVWRCFYIRLKVKGKTLDERCYNYLHSLAKHGMAVLKEGEEVNTDA